MLCFAALKSLAINKALEVDINGVTVLSSASRVSRRAVAVPHTLHFGFNVVLVDSLGFFSRLNRRTRPVQLQGLDSNLTFSTTPSASVMETTFGIRGG